MIGPWSFVHPDWNTKNYSLKWSDSFFSSLDVLTSLLSARILFIFVLMAVALLVRIYYIREDKSIINLLKLVIFQMIITASSIGTSADWRLRPHDWTGYLVTIPLWFLGTLGISIFCSAEDANSFF